MAFEPANYKEVGGPGNSDLGGQLYSVFSRTDSLATMLASGYLNLLAPTLHLKDFVFLSGTSGAEITQVESNDGSVVTLRSILGDQTEIIAASGAIDINKTAVYMNTTGGAKEYTLADGVDGQRIILNLLIDGGDAVVTPTTLFGGSTLTFDTALDACILIFSQNSGWLVSINAGVVRA